jgi:hypothetical protein
MKRATEKYTVTVDHTRNGAGTLGRISTVLRVSLAWIHDAAVKVISKSLPQPFSGIPILPRKSSREISGCGIPPPLH